MVEWPYHDLITMSVEPRTPDAERAVCTDIVPAAAHQLHVIHAVTACVPVHDVHVTLPVMRRERFFVQRTEKTGCFL